MRVVTRHERVTVDLGSRGRDLGLAEDSAGSAGRKAEKQQKKVAPPMRRVTK
jgi:hypothetical protein